MIRRARYGRVASRSGRNAVEDREEQEICFARKARSAGEICWAGRLQPSSPRRSRCLARIHDKPRPPLGVILTERQHGSGIPAQKRRRHVPHRRQGKFRITKDESSSRIGAGLIDRGVVRSRHGGRLVGEPPSFMAVCPPASGKARDCTTRRSNACRPQRPAQAAGRVFGIGCPAQSIVYSLDG